jgi:TonB family protein
VRHIIGLAFLLAAGAVATGCAGSGSEKAPPEVGPPIPTDFTPPPPLGPEPPAPAGLAGRPWLESTHERFHSKWSEGFLEQSRIYLPPSHALNNSTLAVTLELTVADSGALHDVKVAQSSGNPDFDNAAIAVVKDSAPFAAPPPELRSDDGYFYVTWLFARDSRQAGVAGAKFDKRLWDASRAVPSLIAAGRWDDAARRLDETVTAHPGATGDEAKTYLGLARDLGMRLIELGLTSSENALRVAAVHAAGAAHMASTAPTLRQLAREAPDPALRRAAIEALGALGDQEAVPILSDAMLALDGERSAAAAQAMAQLGQRDKAWELLSAKLSDANGDVRLAALKTAADLGAPTSAAALSAYLGDKSKPRSERALAARALGVVVGGGAPEGQKALGAALLDGDAAVRVGALVGIYRAGQGGYRSRGMFYKVEPLFKDKDPQVRANAVLAAAAVDPKGGAQEVPAICRKEQNRVVLEGCAGAFALLPGAETLRALLRLAESGEANVKAAALRALARRSEPEAQKVIVSLAAAEDPALRVLALDAASSGALDQALSDPALEVRASALERLAREGGLRMVPRFLELLLATAAPGERVRYAEAWLRATSS